MLRRRRAMCCRRKPLRTQSWRSRRSWRFYGRRFRPGTLLLGLLGSIVLLLALVLLAKLLLVLLYLSGGLLVVALLLWLVWRWWH